LSVLCAGRLIIRNKLKLEIKKKNIYDKASLDSDYTDEANVCPQIFRSRRTSPKLKLPSFPVLSLTLTPLEVYSFIQQREK
jgi:hypothetical protein